MNNELTLINKKIEEFSKQIDISFNDKNLLRKALTHRSFLNTAKKLGLETVTNERLEFLGDAVLEMIITEYLFCTLDNENEGTLTSFRSALVCEASLSSISKKIGIGQYLLISKGEEASGGRDKDYLLANSFEALLGAIYLDRGYEIAKQFVIKNVVPNLKEIMENRSDINAKNKLQELTQAKFSFTPRYKLLKTEGPDHEKVFHVVVIIGKKRIATGTGNSKQKAEEMSAQKAIEILSNSSALPLE